MSRTISLSLLDNIAIASPCSADWDAMTGDERSRFCGDCRLNVYNIAAMTRGEAEALILEKEGRLCIRLYRRADGTVLTRDCPVGLRELRRKAAAGLARIGAAMALAVGSSLALAGAKGMGVRARQMQPFATICRWLSPAVPAPMGGIMAPIAGKLGPLQRPPSAPTTTGNSQ